MFGLVGYTMVCFAVGCVLTVIVAMFRPIKQNDDWKAWKVVVGTMIAVALVPYGYVEALTAASGKELKVGVLEAASEAQIVGPLDYYKVLWANENRAKVIAVSHDENEFGQKERAVMEIQLKREKDGWHADAYSIVSSFKRQRDSTTMPPYW